MGQTETLIEEAISFAKDNGVLINRGGAIFDWCIRDSAYKTHMANYPISCNAVGAVLLKLGKENLARNGFQKDWLKVVCSYLGVEPWWIHRFCVGFDYGHQILILDWRDNVSEKDKVSEFGLKLAARCVKHEKM